MTRGRREWILQVVEVHVECQIRYVVVPLAFTARHTGPRARVHIDAKARFRRGNLDSISERYQRETVRPGHGDA
jgi:succinyl-CoA synthetase beta subunit